MIIFLVTLSSFAEVLSIGAVIPFVAVIMNPDKLMSLKAVSFFTDYLNIKESDFLIFFTLFFVFVSFLSNLVRLVTLYLTLRLSYAIGSDLSSSLFRKILDFSYVQRGGLSSSEIVSTIITKSDIVTFQTIVPIFTLISSIIMLALIGCSLLIYNPIIAISAIIFFGLFYYVVAFFVNTKIHENSKSISLMSDVVVSKIQQGIRGHKETILNSLQNYYHVPFSEADYKLRKAQSFNNFIGQCPKFVIESFGISFIALLALYLRNNTNSSDVLSTIAILALASQRLLPILQHGYLSWINLKSSSQIFLDVLNILKIKTSAKRSHRNNINFNKTIQLKNINFSFRTDKIFQDVNLNIEKGDIVGIYGRSGSGKSTLIDIIMCFLCPTKGEILIDKVKINPTNINNWQSKISLVPQEIFLFNSSIKENITFESKTLGVEQEAAFLKSVALVCGKELLARFGSNNIGEYGSKLSGGQKQRIGLARAIYHKKEVLVIDEGTNALDKATETIILKSICKYAKENNITIFFITHNKQHHNFFDTILNITNKKITKYKKRFKNSYDYS